MFPPSKADIVRAPGLRAEQLFQQAKLNFSDVKYLMFTSRKKLLYDRKKDYVFRGILNNKEFIFIDDDYLDNFLNLIDKSVFVFSQLEMDKAFFKAKKKHFVIYDILAPKYLELKCGQSSFSKIIEAEKLNKEFIKLADRVFVNGEKNLLLFKNELNKNQEVYNNPFCPLSIRPSFKNKRDQILFFSGGQKWTDNSLFLKNIYLCLEKMLNVDAILISDLKDHENPEAKWISKLVQLPNVKRYQSLSFNAYKFLLKRVAGTLDWSSPNEEREFSTSTRIIQAVANGSAVFTLGNTGLDYFWEELTMRIYKNLLV